MKTVDIDAAETELSTLVDEALAGEEVVLAKEGKPLVRLTPVENRKKDILSTLGMLKGKIWIDDDHFDDPLPDDILRGFGVID